MRSICHHQEFTEIDVVLFFGSKRIIDSPTFNGCPKSKKLFDMINSTFLLFYDDNF
jgi:hypothetical protein